MPPPFQRLSMPQFAAVLQAFPFTRRITAVHMHHTWRPDHSMWRGAASMEGMWRFHTQERNFSDIAQHLTIDPEGLVWTGRHWNAAPASARGHNGNGVAGPFMFEIVGNFDKGCDPFDGAQRQAVFDVIALVQRRFGLDAEALMFHNQAADKSCPGSSIDRSRFVATLRAHTPSTDAPAGTRSAARKGKPTLPLPPFALADDEVVQRTLAWFERQAGAVRSADREATPLEELDYSHDMTPAAGGSRDGAARSGASLSADEIDALRPHVINLRQGMFSTDGAMTSDASDVESILFEHAVRAANQAVANGRPLRLLLYAHGGLVKESTGLRVAQSQVGWWRDNGVYPIHFVWETGLFETLRDLLVKTRDAAGAARGPITDFITDPLLEAGVRAAQAPRIWGSMKSSAEKASAAGGGARLFVERLAAFCKAFAQAHGANGGKLELHAVGHSAGSIFMGHLLQAAAATRHLPAFDSLHFMAPAIRTDAFKALVQPLLGAQVNALTLYTMRRDFERDDHCALIYRKSLLYLVRAACEPEGEVPILGLEDSLREDAVLRGVFGLAGPPGAHAEVVWSRSAAGEGRSASRATTHGGFDDDAPTMESIARRVLGLDDVTPLPRRFPGGGARGARDPWADGVDWPRDFTPRGSGAGATLPAGPAPAPAPSAPAAAAAPGRKRALCVGIDTYPSAPLGGCVNDAKLWQRTLQDLGFEVRTLFDAEARREPLATAIAQLIGEARAGDEIVLQFAGHGTQAPDLDGDEAGGDTPGLDEALCPHDFHAGPLLLDDDLGAMIDRLAPGARLTLFMDCCHSGTNSRAAPMRGGKARSVVLSAAQKQAFVEWRRTLGSGARSAAHVKRSASDPVEVNFGACQSRELAWESNGHGEFTLHATRILGEGGAALTPDAFHRRVVDAFGTARRQTPHMEAPPARLGARLFG
jgi:hypothetical protein